MHTYFFHVSIKQRQLSYGYPQTCPPSRGNHTGYTLKYITRTILLTKNTI